MKKFVRTRGAPPPQPPAAHPAHPAPQHPAVRANGHAAPLHKTNGHANGGPRRDDQHSTLSSRYWSGVGGGGGGGAAGSEGGSAGGGGARGAAWEDPDFAPGWRAIGDKKFGGSDIVWMRPHELSARPLFLDEDGADPDDISSAEFDARWCITVPPDGVGDGHVAAAASALALCPRLLRRVLRPRAQGFRHDLYTGAFSFMFWEWGAWRVVTVDDRLPTRRGRLLSAHGAASHDYTLPLLEKAYAKLYGSYVSLRAGSVSRALQDLSGGVVQCLPLAAAAPAAAPVPPRTPAGAPDERWRRALRVLNSAVPRSTLLVATVQPGRDGGWRRLRSGLVAGQAYLLTGLARVRAGGAEGEEGVLVRARGAGGRGAAGGAWARGGSQWRALTDRDRELLASREHHQAEFWMSFSELMSSFSTLTLVHVGPDDWLLEPGLRARRPWRAVLARRRWRVGYNAGGAPSCTGTFSTLTLVHVGPDDWLLEPGLRARRPWRAVLARRRWRVGYNAGGAPSCTETTSSNPQFHVCIPGVVGGAAGGAGGEDDACHVVVSVTQQYRAGPAGGARGAAGARLHDVGFAVYEVPRAAPRTAPIALHEHRPLEVCCGAGGARETASLLVLPPGDYVVAPHTRRAHTDAGFLLRVFTDRQTNIWEVNEDNVIIRDIAAEFLDERNLITGDMPSTLKKWFGRQDIEEVDVSGVERVLRLHARRLLLLGGCGAGGGGAGGAGRELAGALLALAERRGGGGGAVGAGRLPVTALPALLALLQYWQHMFVKFGGVQWGGVLGSGAASASCYRLRALLWACGLSCSNKVLECVVARYSGWRHARLTLPSLCCAIARLHLAHERYRNLDTKLKSNPLSLEEMILMTIYS